MLLRRIRIPWTPVFILSIGTAAMAGAADSDFCSDVLRGSLRRLMTARMPVDGSVPFGPHEAFLAGRRIPPNGAFGRPENGTHIYILLEDGSLWTSPRLAVDATSENYLASHRSLVMKAWSQGPATEATAAGETVIAAGEFNVVDGKVIWLSNQSGTFRGNAESLQLAHRALKRSGLPFSEGSSLRDLSMNEAWARSFHVSAESAARLLLKFRTTDVLFELNSLLDALARRYPAPIPNPEGLAYDVNRAADAYNRWLSARLEADFDAFSKEHGTKWIGAADVVFGMAKEGIPYALLMVERAPNLEELLKSGELKRILLEP